MIIMIITNCLHLDGLRCPTGYFNKAHSILNSFIDLPKQYPAIQHITDGTLHEARLSKGVFNMFQLSLTFTKIVSSQQTFKILANSGCQFLIPHSQLCS